MQTIAIYTTTSTLDEAQLIARTVVERHLAACAQIDTVESFYRWKGVVEQEREFRVLIKTTNAQYQAVERLIIELHSYELPAIHAVKMAHVSEPYAKWLEENSSASR